MVEFLLAHDYVFRWDGSSGAVLLLVILCPQEKLLEKITAAEVPHVVHLVTAGKLHINDMALRALVLRPVGEHLNAQAGTSQVAQVAPGHAPDLLVCHDSAHLPEPDGSSGCWHPPLQGQAADARTLSD